MTEERWGGDGLGSEDMALPEIKLIQNVGGSAAKDAGASPGDFYCPITDEVIPGAEGFDMVVVSMSKTRTYWGRSDIQDEPPECASQQVTATGGTSLNGDDCGQCPLRSDAPWLLPADQRRDVCTINYNIVGIVDHMPNLIRCGGISALPARELYTQLSMNRMVAAQWYRAFTHVGSVEKKTASGEAFAIKFGKLNLIQDDTELEYYKEMSAGLVHSQVGIPNMPTEEIEASATVKEIPQTTETPAEEKPAEEKSAEKPAAEKPATKEKEKPTTAPAAPKTAQKKETTPEPPPEHSPEAEAEIDLNF